MFAPSPCHSSNEYADLARQRAGAILRRVEPSVARRLRTCSESFSELGFLMLIAYQLEDLVAYSGDTVHFYAAAPTPAVDDTFDFEPEAAPDEALADASIEFVRPAWAAAEAEIKVDVYAVEADNWAFTDDAMTTAPEQLWLA